MSRKKTQEEYELQLCNLEIDYFPLEPYIDAKTNITHECLNNHQFKASPNKILAGRGCPHCAAINTGTRCIKSTEKYRLDLKDKNIEVLEEYINSHTPILHKCSLGHTWKARPTNILSGTGCPTCANRFSDDLPADLYYIKITDKISKETYFKIGITKQSLEKRFSHDYASKDIKVLLLKTFNKGIEAYQFEQKILKEFKDFRVNGNNFIYSGNSELFLSDILQLDCSQ